ncbi:MAG: sensor histidine kinase [Sandaracinaceae bacterium]
MSGRVAQIASMRTAPRELPSQARWFFLLAPPILAFVFDPSCVMEPSHVARAMLAITGYTVVTGLAVHESYEWLAARGRAWPPSLRVPAHTLLGASVAALVTLPQLPLIVWLYPEAAGMELNILWRGVFVSLGYLGGASFVAYLLRQAVQERMRAHEERTSALEARLAVLQAQMQPHFLFNSLNVCAGLVHEDPDGAEATMDELAGFLRYALESTETRLVSLDDELTAVHSYLEVQRRRFGERLHVEIDVPAGALTLRVPPMLLQPLVENALMHGLRGTEAGTVRVAAEERQDEVTITVEDDGVGPGASRHRGTGTGLRNVEERLRLVFGDAAGLKAEASPMGGFLVRLHIPHRAP